MNALLLATLLIANPAKSGSVYNRFPTLATLRNAERMCQGTIKRISPSPYGGQAVKFILHFAGGERAIYKPEVQLFGARYQAEIAAYRLALHLGVDRVPPVCERRLPAAKLLENLKGERGRMKRYRSQFLAKVPVGTDGMVRGAALYHVRRVRFLQLEKEEEWRAWLKPGATLPPGGYYRVRDLSDLILLDLLFANADRWTGGNVLEDRADGRLLMIDNGAALRKVNRLTHEAHLLNFSLLGRVRWQTYQRIKRLDRKRLKTLLARPHRAVGFAPEPRPASAGQDPGNYLTRRERRALLRRRDIVVDHVESLRREHGDAAIFLY